MDAAPTDRVDSEERAHPPAASDVLRLDAHTFRDLEVFESQTGEQSLFEFCNATSSPGGAAALKRRMAHPWASAERITETQAALSFILSHREAFDHLPGPWVTTGADRYANIIFPVTPYENGLQFAFRILATRANHGRTFFKIQNGANVTCGMISTLRRFVDQPGLATPDGELAGLFVEIRALLSRPGLRDVPDAGKGFGTWTILYLDQIFRHHEKTAVLRLTELVFEIDALVAMADVTERSGFVFPEVERGPVRLTAEALVHPFVEGAVANPAELDQERRVLLLTGPNMAGKTTYLRALATALYFAHLGMGVPARRFRFVPVERLFSSFSLHDNLREGISYFRAEALRVKAVAEAVAQGKRVIALMDEPFKGTNVKDAYDASLSILERLSLEEGCLFMFSSHLIELGKALEAIRQIDFRCFEAEENEGRLRFDYLIQPGISDQRLGMRVLREEGIFALLDEARRDR